MATAVLAAGCGGSSKGYDSLFIEKRGRAEGSIHVWGIKTLSKPFEGAYVPVEHAVPLADPSSRRVYVGSTRSELLALTPYGRVLYRYDTQSPIESQPVMDPGADELYVTAADGAVHALVASTGDTRWVARVEGSCRQSPVLDDESVYVVSDTDVVTALARDTGEPLWSYQRQLPEGLSITGHAGLTLYQGNVLTGFTDGVVAALDRSDGEVIWERDTTLDLEEDLSVLVPRFLDVDTTPVVVGRSIYVASFATGLYRLNAGNGTVQWRDPDLEGITALDRDGGWLVASSADDGIVALRLEQSAPLVWWTKPALRGAPGPAIIHHGRVLVGETQGGFVVLDLQSGQELGRVEARYGFSARAEAIGHAAYVVSNGGALYSIGL